MGPDGTGSKAAPRRLPLRGSSERFRQSCMEYGATMTELAQLLLVALPAFVLAGGFLLASFKHGVSPKASDSIPPASNLLSATKWSTRHAPRRHW